MFYFQAEISGAEDVIDVITEVPMETTESTDTLEDEQSKKDALSEEDLMRKGKLLLQHLKNSDACSSTTDIV